jgi:hypothetical protein
MTSLPSKIGDRRSHEPVCDGSESLASDASGRPAWGAVVHRG